jgi:hypothetical protein
MRRFLLVDHESGAPRMSRLVTHRQFSRQGTPRNHDKFAVTRAVGLVGRKNLSKTREYDRQLHTVTRFIS